jgi:hypothetical protein
MRKLGGFLVILSALGAHAAPKALFPSFTRIIRLPKAHALTMSPAATALSALGGMTVHASDHGSLALKPDFGRGPMAALEFKF